jgi:methylmalonyl-CoA/ethylmalonyl-CoA epimerase
LSAFRLHHIGHLVREIPAAADEFVKRFGYVIESSIIEDPVQTACVQFLRQPDADHWLELITPMGADSKLSKALTRGGGLHHLCYEVRELDQACEKLRTDGLLALGSPQPAAAFSGRRIVWFMDRTKLLVELVEGGPGELSLAGLQSRISATV